MKRIDKALNLYGQLESDHTTKNFVAQANARYILFGVDEDIEKFPRFRLNLNEGLDSIAYSYLAVGCYFAEYEMTDKAIDALNKAATIIEYNHLPERNRTNISSFHILMAALAYYASCQYSKAFILLNKTQYDKRLTRLLFLFLSKHYNELLQQLNEILLNSEYTSKRYLKIYDVFTARALSSLLLYIQYGNNRHLDECIEILNDAVELTAIDEDPSLWWTFRLLRIISKGFSESSLWPNLSPLIDGIDVNDDLEYQLKFHESPFFSWAIPERKQTIDKFISNFVYKDRNPIVELFISQRQSLAKVLSSSGAVVSLPTSSGKTRIAEIAILQSLLDNPYSHILYLAPFRSLAFEIEGVLSQTFEPLGYKVSHLYGGAQFNSIDHIMIENSHILIATPEKAKAIIRANDDLASRIALIIIDEGHLLGEDKRYVINEMFTEELRHLMKKNSGKIILLSAVLPNSAEISKWITNDENQTTKSDWRPSSQRFGILEFTGRSVNLEWKGEEPSYNTSFIKTVSNKKQAIAQSAVKLSLIGSVLIYVCRANMVMGQAKEIYDHLVYLKEPDMNWGNDYDWERFELSCIENDLNDDVLKYARKGIMCHSNKLSPEIRLCMERLLRKGKARYIISTSTLAQGVNLGVSTVIIANVFWEGSNRILSRDFWNIAGRAGRAFVDTEGKILYVIDKNGRYVDWHRGLANEYFNHRKLESAQSGLLTQIRRIQSIAESCDIDFEHLLELITENNFTQIPNDKKQKDSIIDFFDWIDDSLLALNLAYGSLETEESIWIDDHFRESLAYIQAEDEGDDFIRILKARSTAVKRMAGDPRQWKSFASSGIPLMSIAKIDELIDEISEIVYSYLNSDKQIDDKNNFLKNIERIINQLPSSHFRHSFTQNELDSVRQLWLSGNSLKGIPNGDKIANEYFSFTIPWVLNAISKKYKQQENEEAGAVFEEFGVLCELGLPSFWAAKIYLSGIRSRHAATELSLIFNELLIDNNLIEISKIIVRNQDKLKRRDDCSENTLHWVEILTKEQSVFKNVLPKITNFTFSKALEIASSKLYCKSYHGSYFLCSSDYKDKIEVVVNEDFPFDKVCDIPGIYFEWEDDVWKMKNKNPHYQLN
jgi:late competence protein required for DNA uptake (superfamily II DNA/RNA helicase)